VPASIGMKLANATRRPPPNGYTTRDHSTARNDREPQPVLLASAAPCAGTALSNTKTRAHVFCPDTTLASSTTGASHDLQCPPDADLPHRQDAIAQSEGPPPAARPPSQDLVRSRSSSRNHLGRSTQPAKEQLHWLAREPLGRCGIIVSFRGGPQRNHERSRDHLRARHDLLHAGSRQDLFARHDRGDRDLFERQDLDLCKQQNR
jgi:hypothetical protein